MLGEKIRAIRQQKGRSIKEVAQMIGMTQSYLSQVERGIVDPSLASLRKIAKALEVPIYYFLSEKDGQILVTRKKERKILELPNSSLKYEFATPFTLNQRKVPNMVAILFRLTRENVMDSAFVHDAEEFVMILKGRMKLTIAHETQVLEEGDSAYIENNVPHKFETVDDEPVEGISVLSPSIY